jgi:tRNA (guanine-N7-)-methyltransferase
LGVYLINSFFAEHEIAEIWITFPDPFPRDGDEKRRLTSPRFLEIYKPLLEKSGTIQFKTDNTELFDYTLNLVKERIDCEILIYTHDFYISEYRNEHHGIQTKYEKMFSEKGEKIKYLKFRFKG